MINVIVQIKVIQHRKAAGRGNPGVMDRHGLRPREDGVFVIASPPNPARYRTRILNRHREERNDVAIQEPWIAALAVIASFLYPADTAHGP